MNRFSLLLLLTLLTIDYFGQKIENKNSVQFELGGHGLFYSINYERIIINGDRFKTTGQLGISYYPPNTGIIELWIPVVINELISLGHHHIEIGAGYILINEKKNVYIDGEFRKRMGGFITGRIGYRYQKTDHKLFYRVGFTPFIETGPRNSWYFYPSGGASIGITF